MKIVLIGASGFIGSALLQEALQRGHQVTAVVTRPEKITPHDQITVLGCDVNNTSKLAETMR